MDKKIWIAITFIAFLLLFTVVGIYSATKKQNTTTDYLLASRNVNPWLTALSAMSTGQSGYLFIGVIGFTYKVGFASIWIPLAWAIGDYIAWCLIFKRLRLVSQETESETVSAFLGQKNKGGYLITVISALITILPWGFGFYLLGWVVAGFGVVGQPHILVRGMAINSADNIALARNIKFFCGQMTVVEINPPPSH